MSTVTREQALAFVEALTGVHGSEGPAPNSVAAKAHLEAALGYGRLPGAWDWHTYQHSDGSVSEEQAALLDYLQGCVDALRPEGYKCPPAAAHDKLNDRFSDALKVLRGYLARHDEAVKGCACASCLDARSLLNLARDGGQS